MCVSWNKPTGEHYVGRFKDVVIREITIVHEVNTCFHMVHMCRRCPWNSPHWTFSNTVSQLQLRNCIKESQLTLRDLVGDLEHGFYFPIFWECHHPNWRTYIFQRGRLTTNQRWFLYAQKLLRPQCFISPCHPDYGSVHLFFEGMITIWSRNWAWPSPWHIDTIPSMVWYGHRV